MSNTSENIDTTTAAVLMIIIPFFFFWGSMVSEPSYIGEQHKSIVVAIIGLALFIQAGH